MFYSVDLLILIFFQISKFKIFNKTISDLPLVFNVIALQLLSIQFKKLFTSLRYYRKSTIMITATSFLSQLLWKLIESKKYDSLDILLGLFSHSFAIACNFFFLQLPSSHFPTRRLHRVILGFNAVTSMNLIWNESFKMAEKWAVRSAKKILNNKVEIERGNTLVF